MQNISDEQVRTRCKIRKQKERKRKAKQIQLKQISLAEMKRYDGKPCIERLSKY